MAPGARLKELCASIVAERRPMRGSAWAWRYQNMALDCQWPTRQMMLALMLPHRSAIAPPARILLALTLTGKKPMLGKCIAEAFIVAVMLALDT